MVCFCCSCGSNWNQSESMAKVTSGEWFSKADYTKCQSQRLLLPSSASPSQLSLDSLLDDSVGLCLYMQCFFSVIRQDILEESTGCRFQANLAILLFISEVRVTPLFLVLCHCCSLFWRWCSTCSRKLSFSLGQQCFGCRRNGRWCLQDV